MGREYIPCILIIEKLNTNVSNSYSLDDGIKGFYEATGNCFSMSQGWFIGFCNRGLFFHV